MATRVDGQFERAPLTTDDLRYATDAIREWSRTVDESERQRRLARVAKNRASGVVGLILDQPRYVGRTIGDDAAWLATEPYFHDMASALMLLASDQSPDLELARRRAVLEADQGKGQR